MSQTPDATDTSHALVGLGATYVKLAHRNRADVMSWFYHSLCAINIFARNRAASHGDVDEHACVRDIQRRFLANLSDHMIVRVQGAGKPTEVRVDDAWLDSFVAYIEQRKNTASDVTAEQTSEDAVLKQERRVRAKVAERKMEPTKIVSAISRLAHWLSKEARLKHRRRELSESALRSCVISEMLVMTSRIADDVELEAFVEAVLNYDDNNNNEAHNSTVQPAQTPNTGLI